MAQRFVTWIRCLFSIQEWSRWCRRDCEIKDDKLEQQQKRAFLVIAADALGAIYSPIVPRLRDRFRFNGEQHHAVTISAMPTCDSLKWTVTVTYSR